MADTVDLIIKSATKVCRYSTDHGMELGNEETEGQGI